MVPSVPKSIIKANLPKINKDFNADLVISY